MRHAFRIAAAVLLALRATSVSAEPPSVANPSMELVHEGELRPPREIRYRLTAESVPGRLARDHVAFLKHMRGGWVALEGPMFVDTPGLRSALGIAGATCPQIVPARP